MMNDVECPYCGTSQEICHDDGYGYTENEMHQQECGDCDKTFVFETRIIFSYIAGKAECLNGGEHYYKPTITYPKIRTRMECMTCWDKRECTPEEMAEVLGKANEEAGLHNCNQQSEGISGNEPDL
jgi:hypothetical protein